MNRIINLLRHVCGKKACYYSKHIVLSLLSLIYIFNFSAVYAQGCPPNSTLPCGSITVDLPLKLSFDNPVANSITDKNGQGTGFTMVQSYSGTRLSADRTPANSKVPGYQASKLALLNGKLQLTTNKGISFLTSNNQINTLGVQVKSQSQLQITADVVNPFNGTQSEQAGIWIGLSDKTYIKLAISGNKIGIRREINDVSSGDGSATNPDERTTGIISGLNTKTVNLKLVIDPATNTASGYYSTDNGATYKNTGDAYATSTISIAGMGLTSNTVYTGLFATQRNSNTAVVYSFDNFNVSASTVTMPPSSNVFSVVDTKAIGSTVGTVKVSGATSYSMQSGNTNGGFALNSGTGNITIAKQLNHNAQPVYHLIVKATGVQQTSTVNITINVSNGDTTPDFSTITWGSAKNQPIVTHEVHGEVVKGKLYIFGGYDINKRPKWSPTKHAYVFDPVVNTWKQIADLPHTPNGNGFGGITHVGLTNDGTNIYFAGGYTSNADGTGQLFGTKQAWRYNVASNTYTRLPDLPMELATGQMRYLNGKLHYMGGANLARADVGVHYALDLDNMAAGWKALAPLINAVNHPGSAVYNGKIYFMGGAHHQDDATVTQKTLEVYDDSANTWTILADMAVARDHIASAVVVIGDRILVLGGEDSHNVLSNLVSSYNPATNTWVELTHLPIGKSAGVAAVIGGNIYYTGGNFSNYNFKGTPKLSGSADALQLPVAAAPLITAKRKLTIYPNPANSNNVVNLKLENFGKNEHVDIFINSISGKLLQTVGCSTDSQGIANTVIDVKNSYETGIRTYVIKAVAPSGACSAKLVVN